MLLVALLLVASHCDEIYGTELCAGTAYEENCKACNAFSCVDCSPGYHINLGLCQQNDCSSADCMLCTINDVCMQCQGGSQLINGVCTKIQCGPQCLTCINEVECAACKQGFLPQNGVCEAVN